MSDTDGGQAVEVNIGDCLCPGDPRPHPGGDIVWMAPHADLKMALAAQSAFNQASNWVGDAAAEVYSVFVRRGPVRWNLVDAAGKPVSLTPDTVMGRLTWHNGGKIVAMAGKLLYQDEIFDPPTQPRQVSQPPSPSSGSTSRSPSSGRKRRTSSPPSSLSSQAATP